MAQTKPKKINAVGAVDFTPYETEKGEEYMNDKQQAHFTSILTSWKQKLMEQVDSTINHLKSDADAYADPLDQATQEQDFSLELRTKDRERRLIKKIETSSEQINAGDYGYCEDCGTDIGIRRLEARPTATKCIDCKTFAEIREKQEGNA